MKKFIAGLIVGLMLSSTAVFASNSISATFGNFNFLVNGQAKTVATQPIVYNNTSYLPVREISTMLGYNVDYQADTKTIKLTNTPQSSPSQSNLIDNTTEKPNSDMSDLISASDLHDKYGVNVAIYNSASFNGVVLTYKGKTIKKSDYTTVDAKMYFNKSILGELGIN